MNKINNNQKIYSNNIWINKPNSLLNNNNNGYKNNISNNYKVINNNGWLIKWISFNKSILCQIKMKFSFNNLVLSILTCHNILIKKINYIKLNLLWLELVLKPQTACICYKGHLMKMKVIIINQQKWWNSLRKKWDNKFIIQKMEKIF